MLKEWLIPQEKKFFRMMNDEIAQISQGARVLDGLVGSLNDVDGTVKELKRIEHETDKIVHTIFYELNRSFITPIEREDISCLILKLDDIMDSIYATANRLRIFGIGQPNGHMKKQTEFLVKSVGQVSNALEKLGRLKNTAEMSGFCIEIHRVENQADEVFNDAMLKLFKETDPVTIIKMKELHELLEKAIDNCEDVANVINDILIKHG